MLQRLAVALAILGTAASASAEWRNFHQPITILVQQGEEWEAQELPSPVKLDVERLSETDDTIVWKILAAEGIDEPISDRMRIREIKPPEQGKKSKKDKHGVYHWTYYGGNPFQAPEGQEVATALDLLLERNLISAQEREAAWTFFDAFEHDTVMVERRSVIYAAGVYGKGQTIENVMPDWKDANRNGKRVPAPKEGMRAISWSFEYSTDDEDYVYHYKGGVMHLYIGDAKYKGCYNTYVLEHPRLVEIERKAPPTTPDIPDEGTPSRPTVAVPYEPVEKELKGPKAMVEIFGGASVIGSQGLFYEGGRVGVFPWTPAFGIFAKTFAFQTPPMRDPAAYGYGPFDNMVTRWAAGGGPFFRFGPIRSTTTIGRQMFEGQWEPGFVWEEELGLHFKGLGHLNPSFETLFLHIPRSDFIWARERAKISVLHWDKAVLRLGGEFIIQGDETVLRSTTEAEYYYTQADGLVEFYKHFNSRFIDGLSAVAYVGQSYFGLAYGIELSWLVHDGWRLPTDVPNGNK